MKIKLIVVGKTNTKYLLEGEREYEKRLSHYIKIEEIIVHYVKLGKLIFWARQKDVLRHQFKLTSEDDIILARQIGSVKHLVL